MKLSIEILIILLILVNSVCGVSPAVRLFAKRFKLKAHETQNTKIYNAVRKAFLGCHEGKIYNQIKAGYIKEKQKDVKNLIIVAVYLMNDIICSEFGMLSIFLINRFAN